MGIVVISTLGNFLLWKLAFLHEESNKIHFPLIARKNTGRRKVCRAPKRIKTRTTVQGKKGGDPPF